MLWVQALCLEEVSHIPYMWYVISIYYINYDALLIFQGSKVPSGTHQFCGKITKYFDYYSSNGDLTVTFNSYSKPHGKGFKMNYVLTG